MTEAIASVYIPRGRPPGRKTKPERGDKKYGKTAVKNGRDLLHGVTDKRSFAYKRFREITDQILVDQGGVENCSESRLQLVRRFAAAAVIAEQLETRLANGEEIDVQQHSTLSSTLVRLSNKIGINRIARDITPKLADYLSNKQEIDGEVERDAED
jgi:hypothetical protein